MARVVMLLIGNIRTDGRVQKEIGSLKRSGHLVTLIQWAHSGKRGGHEHLGVDVVDYPPLLSKNPLTNFLRQLLFNLFAWGRLRRLQPDFVQCNDLNTLPAGWLWRHRSKIVYDAHELFPESQVGLRRIIWNLLEKAMVRRCHAFIQPEKHRRAYFAGKCRIDVNSIALVENFPRRDYPFSGKDRLRERFKIPTNRKILLYTGVLENGRDIESMIATMPLLDDEFHLVLLGTTFKGYEADLENLIRNSGAANRIHLHPSIPNTEMLDYMRSGDIGLVFYRNTNLNNYWCASNKLYEFLLCQKPVITNDYPGLREVIESQGLGACLPIVSPAAIAEAAVRIASRPIPHLEPFPFTWESQEAEYLRLFA